MAKMKKEDIQYIRAKYVYNEKTFERYPVSWTVKMGRNVKTLESYGKNANDFPYPVSKLPKAAQEFLETAVEKQMKKEWPVDTILYAAE